MFVHFWIARKKTLKKKDSETLNDFDRTQNFLNQKKREKARKQKFKI